MTKLQKQKQLVISVFEKSFEQDQWGNFKHNGYRIKMKKNLFRFEKRLGTGWSRIKSVNYKDATAANIKEIIKKMGGEATKFMCPIDTEAPEGKGTTGDPKEDFSAFTW